MPRPTQLTIDLEAISANYQRAKGLSKSAKALAVVKGDAYGHGLQRVAETLRDQADGFATAITEEAHALREHAGGKPVLVMEGPLDKEDFRELARMQCWMVVHNERQLAWIEQSRQNRTLAVWLKFDTGMARLGFHADEAETIITRCQAAPAVREIVLMSHMACADEPEHPLNARQRELTSAITQNGARFSMCNSAALVSGAGLIGDWTRPGLMLYGASPVQGVSAPEIGLRPVMKLTSAIIALRDLPAGSSVGYGARWTAARAARIAVIPIGYADGYPRSARDGAPLFIAGQRAPLVGRISMDMLTVDVTDIPDAQIGAPVELWGEKVSINEVAEAADTIPYTLMCGISPRVRRRYLG